MSYQTIFNGKNLDELVPGYMTLNIEGRGLLGRRINNIEITGRDGTLSQSSTLPDRMITVHFYLNCENAKQREESTRMLHELLHSRENKKIEFTDEDGWFRFGQLSSSNNLPYNEYKGQGSFSFLCDDPYRYKEATRVTLKNNKVPEGFKIENNPVSFRLTVSGAPETISVTNRTTGKTIKIKNNNYSYFEVDIPNNTLYGFNADGAKDNALSLLYFNSNWSDFKIKSEDEIATSNCSISYLTLKAKEL